MKIPVTYKGNTFICTLHDCRDEGNGERGYIAFVDLFKGCVTSTPNNNFRQLERQVRSAIKDWLEPTSLSVAERQRLESLERLVRSKDYFYKAMADSVSDEYVEDGFLAYVAQSSRLDIKYFTDKPIEERWQDREDSLQRDAFKAGIEYALKAQVEGE